MKALVAVVAVLAGLLTSPPAHADDQSFLDAAAGLGYTDRDQTLTAGYAVCAMQTMAGESLTERVLRRGLQELDRNADAAQSDEFAALAVQHLCP